MASPKRWTIRSLGQYCSKVQTLVVYSVYCVNCRKVRTVPQISKELKDIRCCDGDSVTFECKIDGTPSPDVRWEKAGKVSLLAQSGNFTDATKLNCHTIA